jgi:hypothetical protein
MHAADLIREGAGFVFAQAAARMSNHGRIVVGWRRVRFARGQPSAVSLGVGFPRSHEKHWTFRDFVSPGS